MYYLLYHQQNKNLCLVLSRNINKFQKNVQLNHHFFCCYLSKKCTNQFLRFDYMMNYKTYKITLQNNVQNKNKVHFLNNVLYVSNSIVSMV